jgi:hypothetical protein
VLIGLAAAILWLHRGEGEASGRRRWAYRIAAVPVGLLLALYTIVPIGAAITETHKYREPIGAPPSSDYREVAFDASDGVHLSGWYRPTRNGATLLVLHGGGGDRTGAVAHAELLARHGYGVLLYDARGRGKSEGQQNAFGWGWTNGHRRCDRLPERAVPRWTRSASAASGSPPAPTRWSRPPGRGRTSTPSSPTARPPRASRTGGACKASRR